MTKLYKQLLYVYSQLKKEQFVLLKFDYQMLTKLLKLVTQM